MRMSEPWKRVPSVSRPASTPSRTATSRARPRSGRAGRSRRSRCARGRGAPRRARGRAPRSGSRARSGTARRPVSHSRSRPMGTRSPRAAARSVELGGVVDGDALRLVGELPPLERVGADVLGPQAVRADLERRQLRQRHLGVDDRDGRPVRPAHERRGTRPTPRFGYRPSRIQPPIDPSGAQKSKYHDSLQSCCGPASWCPSSAASTAGRSGVASLMGTAG